MWCRSTPSVGPAKPSTLDPGTVSSRGMKGGEGSSREETQPKRAPPKPAGATRGGCWVAEKVRGGRAVMMAWLWNRVACVAHCDAHPAAVRIEERAARPLIYQQHFLGCQGGATHAQRHCTCVGAQRTCAHMCKSMCTCKFMRTCKFMCEFMRVCVCTHLALAVASPGGGQAELGGGHVLHVARAAGHNL